MTTRHVTGFTLLELLASVGIIGILASLLFVSLARAKAKARLTGCASNLRQITFAQQMYVADHEKYVRYGTGAPDPLSGIWYYHLHQYFGGDSRNLISVAFDPLLQCTEGKLLIARADLDPSIPPLTNKPSRYLYGYNAFGINGRDKTKYNDPWSVSAHNLGLGIECHESRVKYPSEMIAFGCTSGYSFSRFISPAEIGTRISSQHSGKANMAFVDGHVESQLKTNWVKRTTNLLRRWNNDGEPHITEWPANRPF